MRASRVSKAMQCMLTLALTLTQAWLALDELEMQWVPISYDWRLNERHYGALQGREKRECGAEFGYCQAAK